MISKILLMLVVVATFSIVNSSAEVQTFHLTVKSQPNILFIGGTGDYKQGQIVKLEAVPLVWQEYSLIGWKVDGRWTSENPPSISMDADHTVEAIYDKTNLVGGVIVDAIPRVVDITVDGTIYLTSELPLSFNWAEGSEHIISISPIINKDPNTRYKFDSWKDKNTQAFRTIAIEKDSEFIALYKTQYLLKSISDHGVIDGAGWHDAGTGINFALEEDTVLDEKDDNIRYVFNSWNQGDYPNSPENYIDLVNPVALKSNWDKEYKLTLTSNIPGGEPPGSGWYLEGKNVVIVADTAVESPKSDINYVFNSWVTKGNSPVIIPNNHSPTTSIIMENPYTIEAQYDESYRVNVWTPFSSAVGGGFYDKGKIADIRMQQNELVIEPDQIRKIFTGWDAGNAKTMDFKEAADLDPEGKPIGNQNLVIYVDRPVNVTAKWKTQYYLDIQTTDGKVTGGGWYDVGKIARLEVKTPTAQQDLWKAFVFDKWSGDLESTDTRETILMNSPKTVIAEWREDSSPAIINSAIFAGLAGFGVFVYSKTHTKIAAGRKHVKELIDETKPFEKFFNLRKRSPQMDQHPSFYQKPKKKKAIINWLLGKE
ncbi:MAG: InlB B-repeat-containing protein [Nitrosopumilaceae archaeon]